MCGHVGIAGKLAFADEAVMKKLLVFDYFRGPDSTGFASMQSHPVTGPKGWKLAKLASNPIDLFDMKRFNDALNGHTSTVFLGHNRLATRGVINNNNAHPYAFPKADGTGDIVCAHNGTLDVSSWRALEEATGEKYDVDSMAVAAAVAKLGIDETIPLLQGAWALVWFDTGDNTLNFIRNKERPLWYAYNEKFDKLFWASEWPTIHAAINLSANPDKLYEKDGFRFWAAKEDWHYKFDVEALKGGADARPKPRVKELKGKEPAPANIYTHGADPFQRKGQTWKDGKWEDQSFGTTSTTTARGSGTSASRGKALTVSGKVGGSSCGSGDNVSVLHIKGTKKQPFGEFLTKEEFDKIAKYGCSWCQADVEYEEPGVQFFANQEMILCPSCADSDEESRIYVDASRLVC